MVLRHVGVGVDAGTAQQSGLRRLACAAWDETELERWIVRAPDLNEAMRARLRKAAAAAGELGYSVVLDPATRRKCRSTVVGLSETRRPFAAVALEERPA
ncbi:hypothetical protein MXD59_20970 [Frankia sp. Ag45/Mut15]|uniref:Transposase n=1 Tax=Frankia umida TaxID=573489 RepID=A0ABT0K364_9ACTN|nr:hypothetical protein [Frankia umida]MCK9878209.1 hypothetical protein [Frankia umida]